MQNIYKIPYDLPQLNVTKNVDYGKLNAEGRLVQIQHNQL